MSPKSEKTAAENLVCRQVVKEILSIPVSQRQIYFIMYLLSLNLENVEHMQELSAALREMGEDSHLIGYEQSTSET